MLSRVLPDPDSLSLAQQVAQMVVVRASGHLFDHEIAYPQWEATHSQLRHYLDELGVGGVIFLGGSAAELALKVQMLQGWSPIPLLLAADIEEGVGQRFSGATWFPPPMALGEIAQHNLPRALAYAEQLGRTTALEAASLGLNWILAPVADVNNNPANPVINVRAFGETPELVTALARAFIKGCRSYPVLTTAKHFPGHGDTATDSHLRLPTIDHDLARLEAVELAPFRGLLASGDGRADTVMTAHLRLSALDAQRPATLSPSVLDGLLRRDLGFRGLIVTDALVMGAITDTYGPYEAAVMAVEAGADVLLMPGDVAGCITAVCEAVQIGRLSRDRIRQSVERLWRAKHQVTAQVESGSTCHSWEAPQVATQIQQLAQPAAQALVQDILHHSSRRGEAGFKPAAQGQNVVFVEDCLSCPQLSRTAPAVVAPQGWGYGLQLVDRRRPLPALTGLPTLVQLFIRGNPFRSGQGLLAMAQTYVQSLMAAGELQAVILYGSHYGLEQLQLPASLPWVFSYGQMPAAQAQALSLLLGNGLASGALDSSFTD